MRTGNGLVGMVRAAGVAGSVSVAGMTGTALAQRAATPENAAATLPITEITAFKDGHALVVRSGTVQTDAHGDVVLSELPAPIFGTFWASEVEDNAELRAVTAQRIEETETYETATLAELLAENIGARIEFKDAWNHQRFGVLRQVLTSGGQRLALIDETQGADAGEGDGPGTRVAAIPLDQLRDVRFVGASPTTTATRTIPGERMTLDLEWDGTPDAEADIALMGVEFGLRWIPSYKVTMIDDENVLIELEATLVNDLADLADARLHMAVGVPSFAFSGQPDPIALAEHMAPLGQAYGRRDAGMSGNMLSNGVMSQVAYAEYDESRFRGGGDDAPGTTPEMAGGERAEDLYVFTIEHLTLDKGARMVLPLASYTAPAETVYKLDLIASPPTQALQQLNTDQQRELAVALDRPVARHVLRITNENDAGMPITTAPALVVKNGRTLAQGLMRYAPAGAKADLEVGAALDLTVETDEFETGRNPDALNWGGNRMGQVDIGFTGCITNRKSKTITIEISKLALGHSDEVGAGGEAVATNLLADAAFWSGNGTSWWRYYSWPWWWHGVNAATRYTWTLEIEPGADAEFDAAWHYFWD